MYYSISKQTKNDKKKTNEEPNKFNHPAIEQRKERKCFMQANCQCQKDQQSIICFGCIIVIYQLPLFLKDSLRWDAKETIGIQCMLLNE